MTRGRFGYGRNSTDDEPGDSYVLQLHAVTDMAYGVTAGQSLADALVWLPKSAVSLETPVPAIGGTIGLWVPDWLAVNKGLA